MPEKAAKLCQLTEADEESTFSTLIAAILTGALAAAELGCMARYPQNYSAQRRRVNVFRWPQSQKLISQERKKIDALVSECPGNGGAETKNERN